MTIDFLLGMPFRRFNLPIGTTGMTASEIATSLGAILHGSGEHQIVRAVHPDQARGPEDIAIALTDNLVSRLAGTKAGAAILPLGTEPPEGAPAVLIAVPLSRRSLPEATELFRFRPSTAPGVHPSAVVEEGARIDPTACIGPHSFVAANACIGAGAILVSHCTVLPGASVGEGGLLFSGVRIGPGVHLGARVVVQSNSTIGSDGFSFLPVDPGNVESVKARGTVNPDPGADATLLKVQSLGGVEIGDDVEVGAQTAIDAGTLLPTRIGRGTKIDNLVQIGHNVQVGENCLLCGRVAVAGSVVIGNRVVLAGGVGVADHLTIADDVVVAGGSGVASNLRTAGFYSGLPAAPHEESVRTYRNLKRLDRLASKVLNPPAS